jgi:hypothetical protein
MDAIVELDTDKIDEDGNSLLGMAQAMRIVCQSDLEAAAEMLQEIKAYRKNLDAEFDGKIKAAHQHHKELVAWKAKYEAPADLAERTIKARTGSYLQEQEALRQAEQRRLDDEAREVEEARRRAEMAAVEAKARELAKTANKAEFAEIMAEAKAEAAAIQAEPVVILAPAAPAPAKVDGVSASTVYKYRIVDAALIPREYLFPNDKMIGQVVRAMRAETRIPGIVVYTEQKITVRAKG